MKSTRSFLYLLLFSSMLILSCSKDSIIDEVSIEDNSIASNEAVRVESTCSARGWAGENGGTNGGGTASETIVTSYTALRDAVRNSNIRVIRVNGRIVIPSGGRIIFQDQSNKTIYGSSGARLVTNDQTATGSGIFLIRNVTNLLIRNLIFEGPGAYDVDGRDLITLENCRNIWVDHCDFQDGLDGNLDIVNGSDYITVSWTRFRYLKAPRSGGPGGTNDHRFSNLIGNSDSRTSDRGKLRVTFARCWWDTGCRERMPRVRFGRVHIVNSLFNSSVSNNCIRAGFESNIFVDRNVFENVRNPIDLFHSSAIVGLNNNIFTNVTGTRAGRGTAFTPPTTGMSRIPSNQVKASVTSSTGAGATLSGNVCTFSGI